MLGESNGEESEIETKYISNSEMIWENPLLSVQDNNK
jgi:hypothetical protein